MCKQRMVDFSMRRSYVFFCILIISSILVLTSCSTTRGPAGYSGEDVIYRTSKTPDYLRHNLSHSVAPGETLWRIAQMYEVDISDLKKANGIQDVTEIEIGTKLTVPGAAPRKHVITLYPSRKWKYIIVHHSATDEGSSEDFNEAHLRRGWQGVGYHFVVDNGTSGKSDGQIETSPRWIKQMNGAHCKANKMNERGIGICLVGNFSKDRVSKKQMDSLAYLVRTLKDYYKIPSNRIMGHGQVPGAATECPGKKFPWNQFRSRIR